MLASANTLLNIALLIVFAASSAAAANFVSVTSGQWTNPSTWGSSTIPSIGDDVTISPGHTVTLVGGTGLFSSLTVSSTSTIGGTGSLEPRITGGVASIINNGSITNASLRLPTANGIYTISGSGTWAPNQFSIEPSASVQLGSDVTISAPTAIVATAATLNLNGFVFTFGGVNFTNNGTIVVGSSIFNFFGSGVFTHTAGSFTGTGNLRFAPSGGTATISSDGNIGPSVELVSGTITGCPVGTLSGGLSIALGVVAKCDFGTVRVGGNMTVAGSLTKSAGAAGLNIDFNGSVLSNFGSISAGFVTMNNSGGALSQTLSGAGSWTNGTSMAIGGGTQSPSTTTIANNITISFTQLRINTGSTLALNGQTLTFDGGTFTSFGTLAVGSLGEFIFNGTDLFSTQSPGTITGSGLVRLAPSDGTANIFGRTQTKLRLVSGTMTQTASLQVGGSLTIDSGAALVNNGSVTTTFADVINSGTVNGNPSGSWVIAGTNFTNNGSISNINLFFSPGACCPPFAPLVTQNLGGSGSWTGNGTLDIASNSQVSLQNDITYSGGGLTLNGSIVTGSFTLTTPASVVSSGLGEIVGNLRRTGFALGSPVAFGNQFNRIRFDSGVPPSEVLFTLTAAQPPVFPNSVTRYYSITANGGSFSATVRLHYLDTELNGNSEAALLLFRRSNSAWMSVGVTSANTTDNWLETTGVTAFSQWTFANAAPTAAAVSVAGRVARADGRGIGGAFVTITSGGGETQRSLTNPFGYYRFADVRSGETYVITVTSKSYSFTPRVVFVSAELTDIDFSPLN